MLKCRGQIVARCHISVTRWMEFEIMPSAWADQPLCVWMSDKMSLHVAPWQHLKTLYWPLMSWAVDSYTASHTVQYRTVCDLRDAPPPRLFFKVVVIDTQRVLDQWLGWHIHWQARYYSSAAVPQIVFQVLGVSRVALEAFMSLMRMGPSVCHQWRGSLPAEREEQGHRDLDLVLPAWEEREADGQKMSHQTGINGKFIFFKGKFSWSQLFLCISQVVSCFLVFFKIFFLAFELCHGTSSQSHW